MRKLIRYKYDYILGKCLAMCVKKSIKWKSINHYKALIKKKFPLVNQINLYSI